MFVEYTNLTKNKMENKDNYTHKEVKEMMESISSEICANIVHKSSEKIGLQSLINYSEREISDMHDIRLKKTPIEFSEEFRKVYDSLGDLLQLYGVQKK